MGGESLPLAGMPIERSETGRAPILDPSDVLALIKSLQELLNAFQHYWELEAARAKPPLKVKDLALET